MGRDALRIDGRALRGTPGRVRAPGNLAAGEPAFFTLMLGLLAYLRPKGVFVGELAAMAEEIRAGPFRHRPGDAPAAEEMVPAIATGRHGMGILPDKGHQHAIGALSERNPGCIQSLGGSG
jgi:hypothetical protein